MSSIEVNEQPEIQFSVLREGSKDPEGPYTDTDILNMLNQKEVSAHDLVFYEGLNKWSPIGEVFVIHEQISHFVDDGQDKIRVGEVFREISELVTRDENIYYIAVQERAGLLSKSKQCIALTDKHIFLVTSVKTGFEIQAHLWSHISNTMMRDEGKELATFSILLDLEKKVDIAHIPLKQVQRLFQLSQEMKEAQEKGG